MHLTLETSQQLPFVWKNVKQVGPFHGKKPPTGSPILHDLLLGVNSENKQFIFGKIAMSSIPVLSKSDTQHLSNFIHAYGLAECIPNVNGGRTLFDVSATICGISTLKTYPTSFGRMQLRGHQTRHISSQWIPIVALDNLSDFWPQAVSMIVWVYATAGKPHPQLFKKVASDVIEQGNLNRFIPQTLFILVWVYITAVESYLHLFRKSYQSH